MTSKTLAKSIIVCLLPRGHVLADRKRRFNPAGEAWLPIMHISSDGWHFTALYSNSRLAHELKKTADWVVIHYQRDGAPEGRVTVVTGARGPQAGRRLVRGREEESDGKDAEHETRIGNRR